MAVGSCILNDGKTNMAKMLASIAGFHDYKGIGAGNDDTTPAVDQHDLIGDETCYKVPSTIEYVANYKCRWIYTFAYGDLASHIYKEILICQSDSQHENKGLVRFVHGTKTLSDDEELRVTVTVEMQQGT